MDNRTSRITSAMTTIKARLASNASAAAERDSLRSQLDAMTARWQTLRDMTLWAELDSGKSIAVGDVVRYLGRNYRCTQAHTKALLRLPTNGTYWERVEDE